MRLLVTGANGFVGHALCEEALARGFRGRGATRRARPLPGGADNVVVGDIDGFTDWAAALQGVEVVVHLAARVHVMRDTSADPLAEFLQANLHATINLAVQAARAGVKRLVYVSSIKVNGEETRDGCAYTEAESPDPQDPYAISKWQAELALHEIAAESGLEVVIVRPPLIYGREVKGNFLRLLQAVDKGIPLPLAGTHNARSMLYLGNMVDALLLCATHPAAAGQTYLVSDGEDIDTPRLLHRLGDALGRPAHLFPWPPAMLKLAGRLLGKADQVERLLGSLQVDSGKIRRELNWTPPYTLQQGLQATAGWYRNTHS
jgi:nucleoside-diphosphate-sugar epimerase